MNKTFIIFTILIFDVLANNTSVDINKPVTQQRMALSLCHWNLWFHPQQSGPHYSVP